MRIEQHLLRVWMRPTMRRLAARCAWLCVLAGVAVQAQSSTTHARSLPGPYKYVIGPVRVNGISDTGPERLRFKTQLSEKLGGAIVDIGDRCDKPECDLIAIDQLQMQRFEVQFVPNELRQNNEAHVPRQTRQMQVDPSVAWVIASKEIVTMIQAHHVNHAQQGAER